jgi:DNA-binding MarR family transcriptional regulator
MDEQSMGETVLWLPQTIELLQAFRAFNPDATVNQVLTFLIIAGKPGLNPKDILQQLGLSDSGSSRTVAALTKRGDRRQIGGGWDVVEAREDPVDLRFKRLFLTRKGEMFINRLNKIMRR